MNKKQIDKHLISICILLLLLFLVLTVGNYLSSINEQKRNKEWLILQLEITDEWQKTLNAPMPHFSFEDITIEDKKPTLIFEDTDSIAFAFHLIEGNRGNFVRGYMYE